MIAFYKKKKPRKKNIFYNFFFSIYILFSYVVGVVATLLSYLSTGAFSFDDLIWPSSKLASLVKKRKNIKI